VVLRAVATVLAMAKEQTVMINKSGRWKEGGERDQREGEPIKGTPFRRGACRVVARFGIGGRDTKTPSRS
jgi:hypothetical protein